MDSSVAHMTYYTYICIEVPSFSHATFHVTFLFLRNLYFFLSVLVMDYLDLVAQ